MDIVYPNGLTSIGSYAFSGCDSIESVILPDSVSHLGWDAFGYCNGLKHLSIGKSLTFDYLPSNESNYYNFPFYHCPNLCTVTVSTDNPVYHSYNNCVIDTYSKVLVMGTGESVIPSNETVLSIGDYAFADLLSLKSIVIPDNIVNVCPHAFYNCAGLETLTIGKGVKKIEKDAFYGCSSLTTIYYNAINADDLVDIVYSNPEDTASDYYTVPNNAFYYSGSQENGLTIFFGDEVERIPGFLFGSPNNDPPTGGSENVVILIT